jgi:general secretion pathway protein C
VTIPLHVQAVPRWLNLHATTVVGVTVVIAMGVSLAWQSADWLRLLRAPAQAEQAEQHTAASAIDPNQLAQLFGANAATGDGPAPNTSLRLTLLGSFVHADPKRSSAIISSDGKNAQRYAIDGEISSGVSLHAVAADHIELLRGGRRESLYFLVSRSSAVASMSQEPAADASLEPADALEENLTQLRERMDALRQQIPSPDSEPAPNVDEPTNAPTEPLTEDH